MNELSEEKQNGIIHTREIHPALCYITYDSYNTHAIQLVTLLTHMPVVNNIENELISTYYYLIPSYCNYSTTLRIM